MKQKTVDIRLPDETVNYLQRLDYEIGGLQVLHTHAMNAGLPLEKRMEIRQEMQAVYAEYQLAKQEMWAEFAPRFPNFRRWWVDFQTGELHVVADDVGRDALGAPCEGAGTRAVQCPAPTGEVDDHA